MTINVLLVGVGGQGIISAAQVLADAALSSRYDVKTSEVHGMAQRGGSVQSMVRWGEEVFSPLIPEGQADFILAFEMLEGLRHVRYLSPDGVIILNRVRIDPLPVLAGAAEYPAGIDGLLADKVPGTIVIDAAEVGAQAGNRRAAGAAMLGALATKLEFPPDVWEHALRHNVPKKALDANLKAFDLALHMRF